ncbi:MAG: hypothetical protein CME64_16860 [Halobacteriovoraceae bacterium]|nr:hypothetical protein [Halobacteriovoraceae bacterium]
MASAVKVMFRFKKLDLYCERLDSSFWAEPINAFTNLFIFLAGVYGLSESRKLPSKSEVRQIKICSYLAMATGIGSFLFHTFANSLTMWLDILPITLFQIFSINFFLQFVLLTPLVARLIFLTLFVALSLHLKSEAYVEYFNGSLMYAPSLVTLFVLGAITWLKKMKGVSICLYASVLIFTVSITARSYDLEICEHFPLGTHFIWHSLNGLLIILLLKAMIIHTKAELNFAKD